MAFARGTWPISIPFLVPVLFYWINFYFMIFAIVSFVFFLYLLYFFRDPHREIIVDTSVVYSAADGDIIYIKENGGESYDIATRMSPFNVHLIRSPIAGTITQITHLKGSHRSVYFARAEQKNERKLVTISGEEFNVELLLLTGAFARRIDVWCSEGQVVEQGERIGIIRFGSQTNVRLKTIKPMNIEVSVGDSVHAGLTPLLKVKK